ncbi:MAG: DMT family transporter [bacterium]|nr:DMT family transporter [bacterium]
MKRFWNGPFLIMIAATLWALDGLLRSHLTERMPSMVIVFYEHAVGFLLLLPFVFKSFGKIKKLSGNDWSRLVILALVSSVLGTALFTEAFARSAEFFDFATPILLQKLQPVFVVFFAWLSLKERITWRFAGLAIIALLGSYLVSFGGEKIELDFTGRELVYILAIGAALAWGLGTILSKSILEKLSFSEATSLRFLLAIPLSALFITVQGGWYSPAELDGGQIWRFLVIGLTTGMGAILIYYRGLKVTQAKVATFAELMFPIVSIGIAVTALNPFGEAQTFSLAQGAGILLLLGSILAISLTESISARERRGSDSASSYN